MLNFIRKLGGTRCFTGGLSKFQGNDGYSFFLGAVSPNHALKPILCILHIIFQLQGTIKVWARIININAMKG